MPNSARAIVRCSRSRATTAAPATCRRRARQAAKRGLDPDKWFNNVELVIAQQIGTETTTYVRNIYKYYVAYRLTLDAQEEAERARRQVAPAKS